MDWHVIFKKIRIPRAIGIKGRSFLVALFLMAVLLVVLFVAFNKQGPAPNATPQTSKKNAEVVNTNGGSPTGSPGGQKPDILFFDPLNGSDRIVTNEFAYWSPDSSCPYKSSTWEMTSGTLLVKNNAGYSGIPTVESSAVCDSGQRTDSAVFRLITKNNSFKDITVSMDYEVLGHGGGGANSSAYDGLHIWTGYQNEYSLYVATIFRWDGNLVIKKKVPAATANCAVSANDGCYYNLSPETAFRNLETTGTWHHAAISYFNDSSNTVNISLSIDGQLVYKVKDTDTHGPAYHSGAVGVRGDNTEFYFKNFKVESY